MSETNVAVQPVVRHLDLFSGIGGFALAAQMVGGIETVGFCEIDPWARKVLAKNFPGVPCHEDVKTLDPKDYGRIDLVSAGYPCQPFSVAGKRGGESDDRNLWPEVRRIIERSRPRWILCENVVGHITLGLDTVLDDLDRIGYAGQTLDIPACACGLPTLERHIWIVAAPAGARLQGDTSESPSPGGILERERRKMRPSSQGRRDQPDLPEPRMLRSRKGVPHYVDRIRGLGNAIPPAVAAEILGAMMEADSLTNSQEQSSRSD